MTLDSQSIAGGTLKLLNDRRDPEPEPEARAAQRLARDRPSRGPMLDR